MNEFSVSRGHLKSLNIYSCTIFGKLKIRLAVETFLERKILRRAQTPIVAKTVPA